MIKLVIVSLHIFEYLYIVHDISVFSDLLNSLPGPGFNDLGPNRLQSYLSDLARPKGLYIYHGTYTILQDTGFG